MSSPSDLSLATRLWQIADRRGCPRASSDRKRARFLAGRAEHGQDLAALDLLGEALEEADDAFCYLALEFIARPSPALVSALIRCRVLEAAIEDCRPKKPLQGP